jgi:hypothetical protein
VATKPKTEGQMELRRTSFCLASFLSDSIPERHLIQLFTDDKDVRQLPINHCKEIKSFPSNEAAVEKPSKGAATCDNRACSFV